jgi:SRSO17 transposase
MKLQDQQATAAATTGGRGWLEKLQDELLALLAPIFCQASSRLAAFAHLRALLAEPGGRRSCWQLAEAAGHAMPRRMQALLAQHRWDWQTALTALQHFILDHLGKAGAALVLDETAKLKQGQMTVGVARQHAGITGQVENCQTVVNCAYVTARGHALFDFPLYLPKAWCQDHGRRERARVTRDVPFQTKTELATGMIGEHAAAGVPFAWGPAMKCTGAPRSFATPASRSARGTCSRSRPASRPSCRPDGRSRSRHWPG